MLAGLLDIPAVTFAKSVEFAGDTLKVERQTETGIEVVEATLPVVVSVTAGVNEPRYPSLKGIMGAKQKPLDRPTIADLGVEGLGGSPPRARRSPLSRRRRSAPPERSCRTTATLPSASSTSSLRRR